MIDFKEIQSLYPDAYSTLVRFLLPNSNVEKDYIIQPSNDKLYEFFDKIGIFLTTTIQPTQQENRTPKFRFESRDAGIQYQFELPTVSIAFNDRAYCTDRMFFHAFAHLQNKIKDPKYNYKPDFI